MKLPLKLHWAAPWAAVLAAATLYPVVVLAEGSPRFPTRAECVHPARTDGDLEVVFGRFDTAVEASDRLALVLRSGFKGSLVEPDGCGLLKVAVHGIPTLKVGREVVAEARTVGLDPSVEIVTG